jgi:hypothetical protein
MNDEVLSQYLDLMEQDELVHACGRLGDIEHRDRAPDQKDGKEQDKAHENSFFHLKMPFSKTPPPDRQEIEGE